MNHSKAYPYLKATLDALIEAAPGWAKAPAKFWSSLSEQLKDKSKEKIKQLEQEIKGISKDDLETMIKETGCEQKEDIELIIGAVSLIPGLCQKMDYRFDRVDSVLEEMSGKLDELLRKPTSEKPLQFPLPSSLHNQTPPEPNFVGRVEMLKAITDWYKSLEVKIGALVGWGGVGKSALVRKWFDSLKENNIQPDGIFWWGFYRNAFLERFLEALFGYLSQDRFKLDDYKTSWQKIDKIKELLLGREYLIILDGLEEMQKSQTGEEFGKLQHSEFTDLLKYIADADFKGLCLITTRFPLTDIEKYPSYQRLEIEELLREDTRLLFQKIGVRGKEDEIDTSGKNLKAIP
ncbi:MAG: NB-ARC domain-containing protein [bacterium]